MDAARATDPPAWLLAGPHGLAEIWEEWIAAVAVGDVDRYLNLPWGHPDVGLCPPAAELLAVWRRAAQPATAQPVLVQVIGRRWDPRWHELRDLWTATTWPAAFHDLASGAGDRLPRDLGIRHRPACRSRRCRRRGARRPDQAAIVDHLGAGTRPSTAGADLAIVGGGSAGLAAAVYGASERRRTVLIKRSALGGRRAPAASSGITSGLTTAPCHLVIWGLDSVSRPLLAVSSRQGRLRWSTDVRQHPLPCFW